MANQSGQKWLVLSHDATMAVPFYKREYAENYMRRLTYPSTLMKREEGDDIFFIVE